MKVLPFKVPKTENESFRVQIENEAHFYGELHTHPEIQITYIKESFGTLVAGDFIGTFEPGSLIIIGSNQPHVFRNDPIYFEGEEALRANCITLFIRKEMFGKEFMQMPEVKPLEDFLHVCDRGLKLEKLATDKLLPLINSFQESTGFTKLVALFNLLQQLIHCNAFTFLASTSLPKALNEKEGKRINAVYQYILKEFRNPISVSQVADIANLTPQSFCRYFKKHTRKSFVEFLNEVRIGNACKLLQDENNTVSSVCYTSGFTNVSNFNRKFKEVMGCSPKGFRSGMNAQHVK